MTYHLCTISIGVIYEGYRCPTFWTEGYSTPTFQDEKVKNFQSTAVKRSDLQSVNYNKTVFGQGYAPDPAPDPRVE